MGQGKFRGYSAGSHPKGTVHPIAIALLEHMKLPGLRSKSWDEFARPEAPRLDFVFTVCDDDPWQSPKGDAAGGDPREG